MDVFILIFCKDFFLLDLFMQMTLLFKRVLIRQFHIVALLHWAFFVSSATRLIFQVPLKKWFSVFLL